MDTIIHRILDKAFNQGNWAAVEELLAPGNITHAPAWGIPNNRMGFKQLIAGFRTAFPDLHCTVEDEIRERDKFAAHWTMRGTHNGLFLGNLPTGRPVEVQGIIFACTENGRIVEDWILLDQMGVLQQLGVVPPPRGV
jgi:steroid delta-isomerase-like uncharacterized protein